MWEAMLTAGRPTSLPWMASSSGGGQDAGGAPPLVSVDELDG